jgi:hypothetical protein
MECECDGRKLTIFPKKRRKQKFVIFEFRVGRKVK